MDGAALAKTRKVEPTLNFYARIKVIRRKVERAGVGERNRLLNWASYKFGQMVAEGLIKSEVASMLLESSAKVCGLWRDDGAAQCRATIKSGLAAGIRDAVDLRGRRGNVVEFKQQRSDGHGSER
jgi:DNA phosphorothioation-dependent restriction protein DptG